MDHKNPRLNASGYNDPVAYEAIKNVTRDDHKHDKRASDTIHAVKRLIRESGYEPLNRIAIKDIKTGKEYR